jgi:sortase (surface protein transpeptidase)
MRRFFTLVGNLMILAGVVAIGHGVWENTHRTSLQTEEPFGDWNLPVTVARAHSPGWTASARAGDLAESPAGRPIARVRVAHIGLDQPVTEAPYEAGAGGGTWRVPEDHVGHAEHTGRAGVPGNAVLFAHVSWRGFPGPFANLRRIQERDIVEVLAGAHSFRYVVHARRSVAPSDEAVLEPTAIPVLTLITCDGPWLPWAWDYTARLVVRAVLEGSVMT